MIAFEKNDFFFASKKFSEAELSFADVDYAAKAAIMSAYSLYGINFYEESLETLERYLKIYPSDKNIVYAHFLTAIIFFEQIDDEKKDIEPVLKANEQIDIFIKSKSGKVYSRNGDDITTSFPEITITKEKLSVLDGELVVKKDNDILSFNQLQKRIGRKKLDQKTLNNLPAHFIAYDILFLNDFSLIIYLSDFKCR